MRRMYWATVLVWTIQVNQLYIIGGDGTHRGALRIASECMHKVNKYAALEQ